MTPPEQKLYEDRIKDHKCPHCGETEILINELLEVYDDTETYECNKCHNYYHINFRRIPESISFFTDINETQELSIKIDEGYDI